jgi:hypothetical protein
MRELAAKKKKDRDDRAGRGTYIQVGARLAWMETVDNFPNPDRGARCHAGAR